MTSIILRISKASTSQTSRTKSHTKSTSRQQYIPWYRQSKSVILNIYIKNFYISPRYVFKEIVNKVFNCLACDGLREVAVIESLSDPLHLSSKVLPWGTKFYWIYDHITISKLIYVSYNIYEGVQTRIKYKSWF